jgi:hypothetical protein
LLSSDRGGGADVPARLGARRSVLAGDGAQELGLLAEGGNNLAHAGAAVALAGAVGSRSWRSIAALVLADAC